MCIKRLTLQIKAAVNLDFTTSEVGTCKYVLYISFVWDMYMGCDQEYSFTIDVLPAGHGRDSEESMDED